MNRRNRVLIAAAAVAATLFMGCPGVTPPNTDPLPTDSPQGISFDLSGATAIGTADMSGASKSAEAAFSLVKILEDGSIQMAINVPEDVWLPRIQFVAISPAATGRRDLFLSFECPFSFSYEVSEVVTNPDGSTYTQPTWKEQQFGSFLHIREDGTYRPIAPDKEGAVCNWSGGGGEDFKPVAFDAVGNIYFVYQTWGAGQNVQALYQYDVTTEVCTPLTAALSGYSYSSFQVSPDGRRLFVQGERCNGSLTSRFMRMYPLSDINSPRTIYYTSSDDVWVRGYELSPDGSFLVMNGWNVRGVNGILRADILSDSEISYAELYNSDTDNWFQPQIESWWDDYLGETRVRGLFDRFDRASTWILLTDKSEFWYGRLENIVQGDGAWEIPCKQDPDDNEWNNYKWLGNNVWPATDPTDAGSFGVWTADVTKFGDYYAARDVYGYYLRSTWNQGVEQRSFVTLSGQVVDALIQDYLDNQVWDAQEWYCWADYWYEGRDKASGVLDAAAIMGYLQSYYVEDVEFTWPNGSGGLLRGPDAFAASLADEPFTTSDVVDDEYNTAYSSLDSFYFLKEHLKKTGSDTSAVLFSEFKTENQLGWISFQDIENLFFDSEGSLWGILGGSSSGVDPTPIQLLDGDGKKKLQVVEAFRARAYHPVGFLLDGDTMYFRDAVVDADGYEIGFHRIMRLAVTTPGAVPEDLLVQLPENGQMEIVDYSVGNGWLYFTGVSGISIVGGKVNLATLEFTPFDTTYVLTNIEVY